MNRRDMLKTLGVSAAAATGWGVLGCDSLLGQSAGAGGAAASGRPSNANLFADGKYTLPPLPYPYDALEPHIDEKTLRLHHGKHHAGYVRGLNATLEKLAHARREDDYASIKALSRDLAFHGSGHVFHALYWAGMSPKGGGQPKGDLAKALAADFGSVQMFTDQLTAASAKVEGNGWGVLAYEPIAGALRVLQAENHQNLAQWGVVPLLVIDVWEHAYYLKYQNRRADYVKAFWNVVNWDNVAARLELARKLVG